MNKTINTIVDCVFDIHFESDSVTESFLNTISKIDSFEEIIKLPIHQIPDNIRKNDPSLKSEPLYEIRSKTNQEYKILVGDNIIGIAILNQYSRWTESFFPKIKEVFETILDSGKINTISRLGLRYVDFLKDEDIFKTGKINIDIDSSAVNNKKMFLRIEDTIEAVSYNKVITNNVRYADTSEIGSIIDIVTFVENNFLIDDAFSKTDFFDIIDKLHQINKMKFKEVINDERIAKYGL
jgi:uncharacterized protein (TIGR04255 family)